MAIDVDGTLLTSRHEVTSATVEAVRRARERRTAVVLATSRPPAGIWPILERIGLVEPAVFIGSQGAIVGSFDTDGHLRVIEQRSMPLEPALMTARAALAAGLAVNWYSGAEWLVSHLDDQVRREARVVGFEPAVSDLFSQSDGPDKILLVAPAGGGAVLTALAGALPRGLQAQTSNPTYLEVTRSDVDKASALRALCEQRRIPPHEVVAIGDGMNDLAMLAFAGTAIAPANAHPKVLAAADLVTTSNDNEGVARALDALDSPPRSQGA